MDISELNDDMEISSEAGHLPPAGEELGVDLASMRDPSMEPDPDFMVEDAVQDTHIGDSGLLTSTQDHNDDEMLDEEVQEPILTEQHETIDYDHEIQDEFDDTINTITDQQFDFGTHQDQVAPREDIAEIHVEISDAPDAFAGQVVEKYQHGAVGQDDNQNVLDTFAAAAHPGSEGIFTNTDQSKPRSPQPDVQVDDELAGEDAIDAEIVQDHETPRPTDQGRTSEEQSQHAAQHTSNTVQIPDETSQTSTEDHPGKIPRSAEVTEDDDSAELHPVKVLHEGSEVYLFPPTDEDSSETFFLHDNNLSHQSLSVLLKACREVLGGSINDEEELEIEFHDLGLHTSEDSAHAAHVTMSQIVDVYLRLKLNEGDTNPQPLYVSLRTRPHFSSRFFSVVKAAEEGKGTSYLGLWQETFSLDPQDPFPRPIEDVSTQDHSGPADQTEYTGDPVDGKGRTDNLAQASITDPDQERIFNDEIEQITGSRNLESYQDYNESNSGPSAIEASESIESEFKTQQIGEHTTHGDVEDSSRADGDANNDGSAETSTLQGDDFGNSNDYAAENDENLPSEGDFFDEAVQSYDEAHEGSYDIGLDEYGDQAHASADGNDDPDPTIQDIDTALGQPATEANENLSGDEFGDSSFAFINDDDFEQPDESAGFDEAQYQESYLQGDDQGNSGLTDLNYEAETAASDDITKNAAQLESLAASTVKSTQPQGWATPPASLPEPCSTLKHAQPSSTGVTVLGNGSGTPTNGTKMNGSNTHTPPEQVFDDSDEINYDDEEDPGTDVPSETASKAKSRQGLTSPKSVKRNRPEEDEEDLIEYATPDPKRRRS